MKVLVTERAIPKQPDHCTGLAIKIVTDYKILVANVGDYDTKRNLNKMMQEIAGDSAL